MGQPSCFKLHWKTCRSWNYFYTLSASYTYIGFSVFREHLYFFDTLPRNCERFTVLNSSLDIVIHLLYCAGIPGLECSWKTWFLIIVHMYSNINRLAGMFWIIDWKTDFPCTNKVLENTHHWFTIQTHYSVLQNSLKNYSCTKQYGCSYELLQSDSPDTDMHSQCLRIPMWNFLVPHTLGRDWLLFVSKSLVLPWVFH